MSNSDAGGAGGAAAAIAADNIGAIKAFGAIVHVESSDFASIVSGMANPLIVAAEEGVFKIRYRYLVSYKGLVFTTKVDAPLRFPDGAITVTSNKIRIPD